MVKTAWVFPGQGSQKLGMGNDLLDLPLAQAKLAQATEILGWSVMEVCQQEEDKLFRTLYTQPCLYVIESILADLLGEHGQKPDLVAGHSLGEYVALYVAGVFDWSTGLHLVKRRAEIMDSATDGMMTALINFDGEKLQTAIATTPDVVIANDNSPQQVVISGTPDAVQRILSQVTAKRTLPLKVSGAFHSPLMAQAAAEFQQLLTPVKFHQATIPVLSNVDPQPETDPKILKQRLTKQITGSVRWREISLELSANGVEQVMEVGPGNVLTGLIKRTVTTDLVLKNIQDNAAIFNFI
jgi:[acyl-carrier-protein] S-malonyltransferase